MFRLWAQIATLSFLCILRLLIIIDGRHTAVCLRKTELCRMWSRAGGDKLPVYLFLTDDVSVFGASCFLPINVFVHIIQHFGLVWFLFDFRKEFWFHLIFVKVFDECDMKDIKAILEGALSDYRAQLGEQENLIRTFWNGLQSTKISCIHLESLQNTTVHIHSEFLSAKKTLKSEQQVPLKSICKYFLPTLKRPHKMIFLEQFRKLE